MWIVVWLFLTMLEVCLKFMIVVFPDHTLLLFFKFKGQKSCKLTEKRLNKLSWPKPLNPYTVACVETLYCCMYCIL